jgi:hypothetical protein
MNYNGQYGNNEVGGGAASAAAAGLMLLVLGGIGYVVYRVVRFFNPKEKSLQKEGKRTAGEAGLENADVNARIAGVEVN